MKVLSRRKATRRFIFGLLSLLPLLLILFGCFRLGTWDIATMNSQLSSLMDWPIVADFYDWFFNDFFHFSNAYVDLAFYYFVYLMMVSVIDLMFGFFLAIIDMFRSFMDKMGGDY